MSLSGQIRGALSIYVDLTAGEIADKLEVYRLNRITSAIDSMKKRGVIESRPHPFDRRKMLYYLSLKGMGDDTVYFKCTNNLCNYMVTNTVVGLIRYKDSHCPRCGQVKIKDFDKFVRL